MIRHLKKGGRWWSVRYCERPAQMRRTALFVLVTLALSLTVLTYPPTPAGCKNFSYNNEKETRKTERRERKQQRQKRCSVCAHLCACASVYKQEYT